ncbi:MAG: flagellar basal body-associated protein FliL [Gammaproteobacteria bacterium]|nr:MAG: flagellar basal body-associated protein FliL [Gammaproteobacteria bacterium]
MAYQFGVFMKLLYTFGAGIASLASAFIAPIVFASSGGESFKEGVNYIAIKPPLVVNYGGPGRVKYIKAELSLRTEDAHNAQEVTHHMPLIRDTLIMLISSVTDEQMASGEGKEKMRLEALAKINEALEKISHPDSGHEAHEEEEKKPAKDEHKKSEKSKGKKQEKSDDEEDEHAKEEHKGPPVSDLLFDNLVVQK